jgi:hypothetical protein
VTFSVDFSCQLFLSTFATPHYPQWLLAAELHNPETGECLCPVALEEDLRSKKREQKGQKTYHKFPFKFCSFHLSFALFI